MPKFYFDIHQVSGVATDDTVGAEFADVDQALSEARLTLADLVREGIKSEDLSELKVVVRDEAGGIVVVRTANFTVTE